MSGYAWNDQVPRAPLCTRQALPHVPGCLASRQQPLPCLRRSYGLMRQSSTLLVPRWYPKHQVYAGCCQPLLGGGPSRRCLCASVSTCLDLSPGSSRGAFARVFPQDNGLPDMRTRSALNSPHTLPLQYSAFSRLQSCTHVQARTCARHPGGSYRSTFRYRAAMASPSTPLSVCDLPEPWLCSPSVSGNGR
jgi:hypothetical protein